MRGTPALLLATGSDEPQWIVRTMRDRGKPIPRWVWGCNEGGASIGHLEVDWEDSHVHHRRNLRRYGAPERTCSPPLHDATIVRFKANDLTITGFEQIEDREYAQSWFCRLAREGWEMRGKPDEGVGHIRD